MQEFLSATAFFDYDHHLVKNFATQSCSPQASEKEKSIALYYAVRDGFRYNPYVVLHAEKSLRASFCIENGDSHCLLKASLLIAAARFHGIPARVGLANVKNHLSNLKLIEWLGTDIFYMHGYADLYIDGKWVKATPAFNTELCEIMGVSPLNFDGENDSLFHRYSNDNDEDQYMEYLKDHGTFADMPATFIFDTVKEKYPKVFEEIQNNKQHHRSLDEEV